LLSEKQDDILQRLVDAAKSEFKQALNILFINHQLIPAFTIFPGKKILGLVQVYGREDEALKSISLAKSKFSVRMVPMLLKDFSSVKSLFNQLENELSKLRPEIVPELVNRLISSQITEPIPLVSKNIVEGFIAFLLEYFLTILWPKQSKSIKDTQQMIEFFVQQELMHPWLQVCVCTQCNGFELIIGSHPYNESLCPKCHIQRLRVHVYLFDEQFSRLKMNDEDLPLFISKYIRVMSASSVEAEPFKWLKPDTEVDVHVKDTEAGIECKTFVRELTISQEDVKSKTGELIQKLERYYKVSIRRVIVATSLPEHDSERLEDSLRQGLENKKIFFESIKVAPGIIDRLLQLLDGEIKEALRSSIRKNS
jgi:hypothetical protein